MRICPHCGMSNSDINKWCKSCGFEIIIEDREAVNAQKSSVSVMNDTKTAGFVGSMGKTHYISGHTSEEAGDVQKHVSGLGIIEKKGDFQYETVADGSTSSRGHLWGAIGGKKYTPDKATVEKDLDSKIYGSVGSVRYKTPEKSEGTPRLTNTTSGLIGNMGDSFYVTDTSVGESIKAKKEISDALWGHVGETSYVGRESDSNSSASDRRTPIVIRRNRLRIIGFSVAGLVLLSIIVILFSISGRRTSFSSSVENAISSRINSEIVNGEDIPLYIKYRNAIFQNINFKVIQADKHTMSATVVFSYVDVPQLIDSYAINAPDAETFYQRCINAINNNQASRSEETIVLQFSGSVSNAVLIEDDDFLNVLSGGSMKEIQTLMAGE